MKVVLPELPFLSPDKHVMYVQCPHACFPMAGLLNFPLADREDVTGMQTLSCISCHQCSAAAASDASVILQVSRNLSQLPLLMSSCRSLSTSTILPGTDATQPVSPAPSKTSPAACEADANSSQSPHPDTSVWLQISRCCSGCCQSRQ